MNTFYLFLFTTMDAWTSQKFSVSHVILLTNFMLTIVFLRFDCTDDNYPSCFRKIIQCFQRKSTEDAGSVGTRSDKVINTKILWNRFKVQGSMDYRWTVRCSRIVNLYQLNHDRPGSLIKNVSIW